MQLKTGILNFKQHLTSEEKSSATIEKYLRDVQFFCKFLEHRKLSKEETIAYKEFLVQRYAPASINSMLAALNYFLKFISREDCCVRLLKIQRQIFANEERELSKQEYQRLIKAAENRRLSLVIQTICGTGIRVSELQYITIKAVRTGRAVVNCKGKTRVIFLPAHLQKLLTEYVKKTGRSSGPVFVTKTGRPLNRSNIWRDMKALCRKAEVSPFKVFPHNLRHLFARTFYSIKKDIIRLADLLGHSRVETTRRYTAESGKDHLTWLEQANYLLIT